ncbi:YndJ family protein [Bacillus pumilus]|uniref:YndJ family protein n=1 Tax=Bacillus pumilus TaxID=1408 RepID=UPI001B3A0BA4|nr:YndJ family protein [Bacillus pumilus]MBQ4817294.1 YndJ family protein [Bacillus pumilus]WIG30239.1 YndJ family protein [Bacillus pumilus]
MNKWHLASSLIFMSYFIATRFMTGLIAEFFVLLAILFFLPTALHFFEKEGKKHKEERLIGFLMKAFPLAAFCATAAFIYHSAWFASGWLLYTILLALFGFFRLLKRGIFPLHELMIDGAWMYLALGGLWFWLYTADIQVMTFSPIIVLLTVIHFHYSAFFIPLFYGFLGRQQAKERALYKAAGWVILLSPVMIAVGISFSRLFDTFSVILYVVALYIYGILCMKIRFRSTFAKGLVVLSSIVLMGTIVLSLLYSAGMLMRVTYISIDQMIWFHGSINAFFVILPGLIGWLIEGPRDQLKQKNFPISKVHGRFQMFSFQEESVLDPKKLGLVDSLDELNGTTFSADRVSPVIRRFYEDPMAFTLKAAVSFHWWIRPIVFLLQSLFKKIGQLYLGLSRHPYEMKGCLIRFQHPKEERKNVRAWIRHNAKGEQVFFALYALHHDATSGYMNIALPLPYSQLTAILKPFNEKEDFILKSTCPKGSTGDEGLYLHTPFITMKLPMEESFHMKPETDQSLTAVHQMKLFSIPFLTIHYQIDSESHHVSQ